jgi:hypothetical protein
VHQVIFQVRKTTKTCYILKTYFSEETVSRTSFQCISKFKSGMISLEDGEYFKNRWNCAS